MDKRTFILCASLGTLVLLAAPITAPESLHTQAISSVLIPADLAPAEQRMSTSDNSRTENASLDLLSAAYGPGYTRSPEKIAPPVGVGESTLWLARAIYSETKLSHEQELVAWVVRNRVETTYRGKGTYREVVLDPYQFSAFNPDSPKRPFLMRLTPETQLSGWQQALWVAYYVRHADPVYRPFSIETRHFYSERSMTERRTPYWADGSQFVAPGWTYTIDERRFRFYEQIS